MKNVVTVVLLISSVLLLIGCKESKTVYYEDGGQQWQLAKMQSGSFAGATDQALPYEEMYSFSSDMTFKKTRITQEATLVGSGTYEVIKSEEGDLYNLTYKTYEGDLVGSCTGTTSETLVVKANETMENTWAMCDGPFKVYKR